MLTLLMAIVMANITLSNYLLIIQEELLLLLNLPRGISRSHGTKAVKRIQVSICPSDQEIRWNGKEIK